MTELRLPQGTADTGTGPGRRGPAGRTIESSRRPRARPDAPADADASQGRCRPRMSGRRSRWSRPRPSPIREVRRATHGSASGPIASRRRGLKILPPGMIRQAAAIGPTADRIPLPTRVYHRRPHAEALLALATWPVARGDVAGRGRLPPPAHERARSREGDSKNIAIAVGIPRPVDDCWNRSGQRRPELPGYPRATHVHCALRCSPSRPASSRPPPPSAISRRLGRPARARPVAVRPPAPPAPTARAPPPPPPPPDPTRSA
jgi:hypothetical protein